MQDYRHGTMIYECAWRGARGWRAVAAKISHWHRRIATRRSLRELEARRLTDIGLTEQDRRRESAKWFWQD